MKRKTSEDWDRIIDDFLQSGLSQKEYSHKNGLNYWTFRDQRLKRETDQNTKKNLVKVPVQFQDREKNSGKENVYRICFPSGIAVELPLEEDHSHLQKVLQLLASFK